MICDTVHVALYTHGELIDSSVASPWRTAGQEELLAGSSPSSRSKQGAAIPRRDYSAMEHGVHDTITTGSGSTLRTLRLTSTSRFRLPFMLMERIVRSGLPPGSRLDS